MPCSRNRVAVPTGDFPRFQSPSVNSSTALRFFGVGALFPERGSSQCPPRFWSEGALVACGGAAKSSTNTLAVFSSGFQNSASSCWRSIHSARLDHVARDERYREFHAAGSIESTATSGAVGPLDLPDKLGPQQREGQDGDRRKRKLSSQRRSCDGAASPPVRVTKPGGAHPDSSPSSTTGIEAANDQWFMALAPGHARGRLVEAGFPLATSSVDGPRRQESEFLPRQEQQHANQKDPPDFPLQMLL